MSSFYSRNIVSIIFVTILSIDFVAMQTDFLASLHLISDGMRSVFMGWLGCTILIAICVYPIFYYLLKWLRLIPAKLAPILEGIPYFAFGLWLIFIAYLTVLTEFDTVSFRLKPGISLEQTTVIYNDAQSKGIVMTIVSESGGTVAWANAKYALEAKELCKESLDTK